MRQAVDDAAEAWDQLFGALANRHRRDMIRLLALQPHSISRLATILGLSLPAINRHLHVMARAGMIRRRKLGRTTFLTLDRAAIRSLQAWLGEYHAYWGSESESLENYEKFLSTEPMPPKESP